MTASKGYCTTNCANRRKVGIGLEPMTHNEVTAIFNAACFSVFKVRILNEVIDSPMKQHYYQTYPLRYSPHIGRLAGLEPATSGSRCEVTAFCNAVMYKVS